LPSQVKVLKLHGSINWYAAQRGGPGSVVIGSDLVGVRPVVGVDADWSYLGYEGLRDPAIANRILTEAAIMMPVEHKKFYYETSLGREWQNFWDDLWNQAGELLGESEEIVMIGYSLPAFDKRAREVLLCRSNHDAHVTICCGTDSDRIQQEFRKHGFSHLRYTANLSFEDWLGQVKQGVLMHRRKLKSGTKWGNWVLDTKRLTLDFKKRNDEYEVDLEDIRDSATMLDWIFQIQGKAWATHKIMGDLLDAFNDVFSPQANLCSGGKDHKINPKNHLAKTLS